MKIARIITVVAVFSISDAAAQTAEGDETCKALGSLAEQIMSIRQTEFPMSSAIEKLVNTEANKLAATITRTLIVAAYKSPAFSSEEVQKKAVARFRNDVESECYSGAY